MTTTLERPRVEESQVRPPQVTPPTPLVRWIPWLTMLVVVVIGAVALWIASEPDGSFDRVEEIRFELIRDRVILPDVSAITAEQNRFLSLRDQGRPQDTSFATVEELRFEGLRPES
ncbi:MAG: hypothetical protein OEX04_09540 [Acidimicrobiia bacterium]|nr:hypothetical protein [Acidimicrobiia bacterium]MDH4307709.1 hypothetical protein [Acidimicrobiia bacterium]MDH5294263.1 hypothetical protein [Acidimicrobiia bacterium]